MSRKRLKEQLARVTKGAYPQFSREALMVFQKALEDSLNSELFIPGDELFVCTVDGCFLSGGAVELPELQEEIWQLIEATGLSPSLTSERRTGRYIMYFSLPPEGEPN